MPFSKYLDGKRGACRALVAELGKTFAYVGILGTDVHTTVYRTDRRSSAIRDGEGECGFVVRLHNGRSFFEYSLSDLDGDAAALAAKITDAVRVAPSLEDRMISCPVPSDEPLKKDFLRESDFEKYSDGDIMSFCSDMRDKLLARDTRFVNAVVSVQPHSVSKLFVSKNRELSQHYGWVNGTQFIICRDGRMVQAWEMSYSNLISEIMKDMPRRADSVCEKALNLTHATPIEPGIYDVITDSSITGLIAHEAFGHGVEMDQFVKDRALAKNCVGQYVASPIANMHDGAAAAFSVASYFFDDDGVLASDTQIIKDGVLVAGLSDIASAAQLGTVPTGNGRRESYERKVYTRMTNTYFEGAKEGVTPEDMIASVKYGFLLESPSSGMEDPKNWGIQCMVTRAREIKDGKLTGRVFSPIVLTGYVPDLLKSVSMMSSSLVTCGGGFCGKGYKEWVKVSDGGPYMKARIRLG